MLELVELVLGASSSWGKSVGNLEQAPSVGCVIKLWLVTVYFSIDFFFFFEEIFFRESCQIWYIGDLNFL